MVVAAPLPSLYAAWMVDTRGEVRGRGGAPSLRVGPRSCPVTVLVTPAEASDLAQLAEAWGVRPAGATWLIVAERLAWYRRQSAELGPMGLAAVASASTFGLVVPHRFRRRPGGVPPLGQG